MLTPDVSIINTFSEYTSSYTFHCNTDKAWETASADRELELSGTALIGPFFSALPSLEKKENSFMLSCPQGCCFVHPAAEF